MADIRKPDADNYRLELMALAAMTAALRPITTNRGRGEFLLQFIEGKPFIAKYLRAAYDPKYQYGITVMGAMANFAAHGGGEPAYPSVLQLLKKFAQGVLIGEEACQAWVDFLDSQPKELWATANGLLDKNLECGLTRELVNKVFARLTLPPIAASVVEELGVQRLTLGISSVGTTPVGHATAWLTCDGERAANMSFVLTEAGLNALRILRDAGIHFEVPAYIKWDT